MKKIFLLLHISIICLLTACSSKTQETSLEGNIKNLPENVTDVILMLDNNNKSIKINNGFFKDTLQKQNQYAILQIGSFRKVIFIKENTSLKINVDIENFNNTITFTGESKKENEYLHQREMLTTDLIEKIDSLNNLSKPDFTSYVNNLKANINSYLTSDLHPKLYKTETEQLDVFIENLEHQYNAINQTNSSVQDKIPSPSFNYENYNGGNTSLSDLKGNYVYIDIWATWCPPCRAEIPYLKELEENFKNKNIKFVSISIDNPSAKGKWKNMIKEKNMGGIQLFANGDQNFISAYEVTGIPRFILLDPDGNIINANAPRPSSQEINDLLKKLL